MPRAVGVIDNVAWYGPSIPAARMFGPAKENSAHCVPCCKHTWLEDFAISGDPDAAASSPDKPKLAVANTSTSARMTSATVGSKSAARYADVVPHSVSG